MASPIQKITDEVNNIIRSVFEGMSSKYKNIPSILVNVDVISSEYSSGEFRCIIDSKYLDKVNTKNFKPIIDQIFERTVGRFGMSIKIVDYETDVFQHKNFKDRATIIFNKIKIDFSINDLPLDI